MREYIWLRLVITAVAGSFAAAHLARPTWAVDGITLGLFVLAVLPWLAPIFRRLEFPGGWKFEFAELQKATQDQANATIHQTLAIVITWVQAHEVRESRRLLYDLEDAEGISGFPIEKWQEQWKQGADRVCQAFNSAAAVAKQDARLQEVWIRPTRRAILKSWWITQSRVKERRREQADVWENFDWLANEAKKYCNPGEETAWTSRRTSLTPTGADTKPRTTNETGSEAGRGEP